MTAYLLDSNILISLANETNPWLQARISDVTDDELFMSSITWLELQNGIRRLSPDGSVTKKMRLYQSLLEELSSLIHIESFVQQDAEAAAMLYDRARRMGRMLSLPDAMIAGQALSRDFVLVSGDRRAAFEELSTLGLRYENWLVPGTSSDSSRTLNDNLAYLGRAN